MSAVRVNGVAEDRVSWTHRGLNYGDGLFETILLRGGSAPLWPLHWDRLSCGAAILGLQLPDPQTVHAAIVEMSCEPEEVAKLIVSRRPSGRGYRPASSECDWIIAVDAAPSPQPPLTLILCETRLAIQPRLAGLKHLCRLEQVLAQAECAQAGVAEGLMCDTLGSMICATHGNLFVRHQQCWRTPALDAAGVAGVCRRWLLEQAQDFRAEVARLTPEEVLDAEEVFVCNAVRGPQPVISVHHQRYPLGETTSRLMQLWQGLGASDAR